MPSVPAAMEAPASWAQASPSSCRRSSRRSPSPIAAGARAINRLATLSRSTAGTPVGTIFSFVLNEPARVTLEFIQQTRTAMPRTLSFTGHVGTDVSIVPRTRLATSEASTGPLRARDHRDQLCRAFPPAVTPLHDRQVTALGCAARWVRDPPLSVAPHFVLFVLRRRVVELELWDQRLTSSRGLPIVAARQEGESRSKGAQRNRRSTRTKRL